MECRTSEKLLQLTRIIAYERKQNNSAKFITYFATCACVDYFYRVRWIFFYCRCIRHDIFFSYLLPYFPNHIQSIHCMVICPLLLEHQHSRPSARILHRPICHLYSYVQTSLHAAWICHQSMWSFNSIRR